MKIKILITLTFSILLFWACTPEVDEDQLVIYSQNNSVFEHYYAPDSLTVLVKSRYTSNPVKNGVSLGDTSYSANTLFVRENNLDSLWLYLESLNNDTSLYVAQWNDVSNDIFIKISDSLLYVRNISSASLGDTISFDPILYPDTASFIELSDEEELKIETFNNGQWYKTYSSWKDDIINIYR